ncbi:MAG: GIY-YIG nuclease family protein [Methylotenera sp.]|nr:GIY-YIG nuclease family protein [Methylotenera sp.]MDD4926668.1 GIY-YIG nuclease family protein [Methylotenera sp.]NOU41554.1 GIY-YIG nuclease family protein [Methylotenera sp.]
MQPCVYMMASGRNGTLYIGVTSSIVKRVWQHKNEVVKCFTEKYTVHQLIWYEVHENMESAISREKSLKKWNRIWKLRLIEQFNPEWQDLYEQLT